MRALAITGIETAWMICLMRLGLAMRATPPSARIIAGTRSSAMTESRTRLFGDAGLLDVHHVHDDAALQHLGEADLQAQTSSSNTLVFILLGHFP